MIPLVSASHFLPAFLTSKFKKKKDFQSSHHGVHEKICHHLVNSLSYYFLRVFSTFQVDIFSPRLFSIQQLPLNTMFVPIQQTPPKKKTQDPAPNH